jgi:predicted nucleic-acid-binding protein
MIALDTNVLARYLLRDDEVQYQRAVSRLTDGSTYAVPITVSLELAWVLGTEGYERAEIADALRATMGLPMLNFHDHAAMLQALQWYEAGLDFPDSLHAALSAGEVSVITFDKRFVSRAKREGVAPTVELV